MTDIKVNVLFHFFVFGILSFTLCELLLNILLKLHFSIMQAVVDFAVPYLHVREAFGQKIGHFQV